MLIYTHKEIKMIYKKDLENCKETLKKEITELEKCIVAKKRLIHEFDEVIEMLFSDSNQEYIE
jgi:predicted translin family RNA/ssDNA-binding protein